MGAPGRSAYIGYAGFVSGRGGFGRLSLGDPSRPPSNRPHLIGERVLPAEVQDRGHDDFPADARALPELVVDLTTHLVIEHRSAKSASTYDQKSGSYSVQNVPARLCVGVMRVGVSASSPVDDDVSIPEITRCVRTCDP